jgi:hypothetical protein
VAERTGGSVRVELGRGYDSELPATELRLARALEAGRAEIGYLPARAWSAAGIPAFRALLAPFAVTTDETAQALATGEIAPIESRGSESGSWRGEVPRED